MSLTYTKREPLKLSNGNTIHYKEHYETCYHIDTPDRVVFLLHTAREQNTRLKITLGDAKTGKPWDDIPECGYIGRSTGTYKVPLLIPKRSSRGGGALLDHCIVKIEYANKKNGTIPLYDITK